MVKSIVSGRFVLLNLLHGATFAINALHQVRMVKQHVTSGLRWCVCVCVCV